MIRVNTTTTTTTGCTHRMILETGHDMSHLRTSGREEGGATSTSSSCVRAGCSLPMSRIILSFAPVPSTSDSMVTLPSVRPGKESRIQTPGHHHHHHHHAAAKRGREGGWETCRPEIYVTEKSFQLFGSAVTCSCKKKISPPFPPFPFPSFPSSHEFIGTVAAGHFEQSGHPDAADARRHPTMHTCTIWFRYLCDQHFSKARSRGETTA
jgi:hypothetical protein